MTYNKAIKNLAWDTYNAIGSKHNKSNSKAIAKVACEFNVTHEVVIMDVHKAVSNMLAGRHWWED